MNNRLRFRSRIKIWFNIPNFVITLLEQSADPLSYASWIHSYFDSVMMKFMINNRRMKTDNSLLNDKLHEWKKLVCSGLPAVSRNNSLLFLQYIKSFTDQVCLVKMAGHWPPSFLHVCGPRLHLASHRSARSFQFESKTFPMHVCTSLWHTCKLQCT